MRLIPMLLILALAPPTEAAPASNAQLCRAQLELLVSGNKLTADEEAAFEAQCDCLEDNPDRPTSECAEERS